MKFNLKRLIGMYGQPILIYPGTRTEDGTSNGMGEFIPDSTKDKQPIKAKEPVIPTSGNNVFADNLALMAGGTVQNYSATWYSLHDVEIGTVVSTFRHDGSEKKYEVAKKIDYGPITDITIYYLQESDQHAANI